MAFRVSPVQVLPGVEGVDEDHVHAVRENPGRIRLEEGVAGTIEVQDAGL